MKKIVPYIGLSVQLIVFAMLTWLLYFNVSGNEDVILNVLQVIILIPMWFISFCIVIYPLFFWNEKLKRFYDIVFEFPITVVLKFSIMQINILMVGIFLITCLIPVILAIAFIPDIWELKWGTVYVISLLTLIFYTYKSALILKFLDYVFNYSSRDKKWLYKVAGESNPRIISYSMMILIYIIYNFDAFSANAFAKDINLLKEVFVTFIAIDTLIQILKVDKNK